MICPASHYADVHGNADADNLDLQNLQRTPRSNVDQSVFPLPHNTHLYPGLIRSYQSLVEAMRTNGYCRLLDTMDDGGGLQWDFTSRMFDQLHKVCGTSIWLQ